MRHVGPSRVELGTRTIFNLLGPLSNPAGVKRQLVGVFAPEWVEPLAHVLKDLGAEAVWVVHGEGLDEMTTTGPTRIAELRNGAVRMFEVEPSQARLATTTPDKLKGGEAAQNAKALKAVLDGAPGAYRDIAILNAAGALVIADKAADIAEGARMAAQSIDSGAARARLDDLIRVSNA